MTLPGDAGVLRAGNPAADGVPLPAGAGAEVPARAGGRGVARNAVHSFGLKLGFTALTIGTAVLMARLMGTTGYGVYAFVFAGASLLAMPLQLGVPTLLLRQASAYEARAEWGLLRGLLRRSDQALLAAAVALALVAAVVLPFVRDPAGGGMRGTILWSVLLVPAVALGNARGATLRGLHHVAEGLLPEQLIRPAGFLLLVALAAAAGGLTAPVATACHAAAALGALAAGAWMLRRRLPPAYARAEPAYDDRAWLRSIGPLSALAGVQACLQQFDVFVLGLYAAPDDVALYRVALQGATLVVFTQNAVNVALGPQVARSWATGDLDRLQRLLARSSRLALATGLVPVLVFVLAGRPLLGAVFGPGYVPAYAALLIVAVGELVNVASGSVGLALNMTGHEKDALRGMAAAGALNVVLNLLLIPRFGMEGAAVAMAISLAAWNLLLSLFLYRRTGLVAFALPGRFTRRAGPGPAAGPRMPPE